MVRFLITRPIAVIMVYVAAIALGVVSYYYIPVSLMPDIPIPEITVHVSYKNSSARELENAVVRPLRVQLMQVGHINDIRSETRNGSGTIRMRFDFGTNVDYAFIETNEKIDAIMSRLPRDMERPKAIKASATDIPVFYLNLSLGDTDSIDTGNSVGITNRFIELCEFVENVIRKRIEQLPEVALVDISGMVNPQLTIEPDRDKLHGLGMTANDLENILAQNNIEIGSLLVRDGHYQYNIRFTSVLRTCEDVENIYFKLSGKILQMKDIAHISVQPQEQDGMCVANGKPAITMAIIKQADARLSSMRGKIEEMVDAFEKEYPGIHFEASQDQTQLLDVSIANLKQNLGQGLLLVILVAFLFLKDLRSPLLIGLTLLVSVVICMLVFRLMGLSINIISLTGLILAVGNMMDNSIVVTDNITQYRERGMNLDNSCVTGTNELITPMLSSMLTNISVFLPLIFLSGLAGALIYDQAVSVAIGLSVSYIVGITLMPVIYKLFYQSTRFSRNSIQRTKDRMLRVFHSQGRKIINLEEIYGLLFNITFRYPKTSVVLYTIIIPLGILSIFLMRKEKMPPIPQTEVIVNINWNENIHLAENKRRVFYLLNELDALTTQSNSYIGRQQFLLSTDYDMVPSEAKLYIKTDSPENITKIKTKVIQCLSGSYPKGNATFEPPTTTFEKLFTSSEPPLIAEVSTVNRENNISAIPNLLKLNQEFNSSLVLNSTNRLPLQEHINLIVDLEKLILYNISFERLYKEIKTAFNDNQIGILRSNQQFIPIIVSGGRGIATDIIEKTLITNNQGVAVPLESLVSITKGQDIKTITAGKDGEYIPFTFSPTSKQKDKYIDEINGITRKGKIFNVKYSGALFTGMKLLRELSIILIISMLLLYFILAAQFESLVQPLLVLIELPIDIAGALVLLYLLDFSLNIMSLIGIVIMCGIIINDSILKIDVINQLRKEGYSLMEAIREGGHRRLRAILMTSLTSMLAMVPLLFSNDLGSELQKPFSYALIGGMAIGTFVSLFFIPLVYWYIYRNGDTPSKMPIFENQ